MDAEGPLRASRRPIADDTLRAISKHLRYEIDMFAQTTNMLGQHIIDDIQGDYLKDTVNNALIEAFTTHTRNLMAFLYVEPKWPDDVTALDFFLPEEWDKVHRGEQHHPMVRAVLGLGPANKSFRSNADHPALKAAKERVGKEIAHLTYKRLTPDVEGRLWPHRDIVDALVTDLHRFVDQVPRDRVHDGFTIHCVMSLMALVPAEPTAGRTEPGGGRPVATTGLRPTAALDTRPGGCRDASPL